MPCAEGSARSGEAVAPYASHNQNLTTASRCHLISAYLSSKWASDVASCPDLDYPIENNRSPSKVLTFNEGRGAGVASRIASTDAPIVRYESTRVKQVSRASGEVA